ncbi:enoyl-CoA hydratase-related protein [Yoonia sp.]|uniref:enoyl-CoA hydratase-related protein n=1 Tax=Yoonia sp. TaxID=2212373 RepID=UPI0019E08636|nr:enoyl-CoA hydratase-related protein [Yoonia sp.]MBE0414388.1 enoyl-CoA hydratase/isomerase family protein [Yoonia sp.]
MAGDVAVVMIAAPPVNALNAALRAQLWDIFQQIAHDPQVRAVVLLAKGRIFSAGEDICEFGQQPLAPTLSQICNLVEVSKVPVIVGLHGAALGGGVELAMAAHYRIASPAAVIGLPEMTLGLVPGAGGTQRLPRLIGAKHALNMILGGRPITADFALQIGLLDAVTDGDLADSALAMAQKTSRPRPTYAQRNNLRDGVAFLDEIAARRNAVAATGRFASQRALECVEAALLLPFYTGLAFEADAFARCVTHPQSQALRHVFLAERRIAPRLLARTDDGWRLAEPLGVAAVDALQRAARRAIVALRERGVTEGAIDRAHVDDGFRRGPFGGRDGHAGPQGPDIQRRMLAALVAEGTRLLAAGIVARASDIDVLAVHGLGYPRARGGPMTAAKLAGLLVLAEEMKQWAADDPVWQPPPLLLRAGLLAGGFDALSD